MRPLPHRYFARAVATPSGDITLDGGTRVELLLTNSPPEFDGPDDRWSPETLLLSSAAACLLLTFRAAARAAHLSYESARCDAEGRLDRVDGVTAFVEVRLKANVVVSGTSTPEQARALVAKAERHCLITNSLRPPCTLEIEVDTSDSMHETADHSV